MHIDKQADKEAALLLKKYDKLRQELYRVEDELTKAAVAYGRRRGYLTFRVENMRIMMDHEQTKRSNAA